MSGSLCGVVFIERFSVAFSIVLSSIYPYLQTVSLIDT